MLLFTEERGFHESRKVTALRRDREERGVTSGPLKLHYTQSLVGQVAEMLKRNGKTTVERLNKLLLLIIFTGL